jgi:hypothetical protein
MHMPTMTEVTSTLNQERTILIDAIQGLPDSVLNQKGIVGEWSIKNVLAHLNSWEQVVIQMLPERLATGVTPKLLSDSVADEDGWNAQQVNSSEHMTPQEQLAQFQHTRQELLQLIQDIGEEGLQREHPWPSWQGTVAEYILDAVGEHEREHRDAVLTAIRYVQEH